MGHILSLFTYLLTTSVSGRVPGYPSYYPTGTRVINYPDKAALLLMSFWRRRLDIVVTTSLQCSRQPSSVVWDVVNDDYGRHGRYPSLDVQQCHLSLSVVVVEIHRFVRGQAITMSMSRRVYLSPLSVPESGYGYSSMTSIPAILLRLSWRPCPDVSVPVSCPLLPVPGSGNRNSVIKEIKIQTLCDR